jgi:hypothetical protein
MTDECVCVCGRSWPVVSNAVPVSVPPSLPPAVALLFICVHIPLLALSILVGPAQVRLRCCPCCGAFIQTGAVRLNRSYSY